MDLKNRASSSESDGEAVDTSVKILINDVTPCDSREFLHLPCSVLQCASQNNICRTLGKKPCKGLLQRRASWSCTRIPKAIKKIHKCWSLGSLSHPEHLFNGQNTFSFNSQFSNPKEGSSDSIPEGIKEKQRSFSAGSREDVFMFCNQLQDSVQSMNDMMSRGSSQTLTANSSEPKAVKKHSLVALGKNARKEEWLITPRSTLQKSVSTPSIVAAQEIQEIAHRRGGKERTFGRNRSTMQNVRNSCIEIMHEDDEPEEMNIKRLSSFSLANLLRENLLKSGAPEEEDKPFRKQKKRGSLFFRKKKNKEKENKKNSSHHFVSICFSTAATCDVCNRALANKAALKCETCSVTIHDSSCKDHVPNCILPKNHPTTTSEKEPSPTLLTPSGSIRYPTRYRNFVGAPPLINSHSSSYIGKHTQQSKEKRSSIGDAKINANEYRC